MQVWIFFRTFALNILRLGYYWGNYLIITYPCAPYIYYIYNIYSVIYNFEHTNTMKLLKFIAKNCKIHPVLYDAYLMLQRRLSAEMVHRRRRKSTMCIEVIFYADPLAIITGRLNTLKEAEKCGFWIMCRRQTKKGHTIYKEHPVFQLFLTPVHPKKRHEQNTTITSLDKPAPQALMA